MSVSDASGPVHADYERALKITGRHWGSMPGTKENDLLQKAITVVLAYEARHT